MGRSIDLHEGTMGGARQAVAVCAHESPLLCSLPTRTQERGSARATDGIHSGRVRRWGVERLYWSPWNNGEGGEGRLECVPPRLGGAAAM